MLSGTCYISIYTAVSFMWINAYSAKLSKHTLLLIVQSMGRGRKSVSFFHGTPHLAIDSLLYYLTRCFFTGRTIVTQYF